MHYPNSHLMPTPGLSVDMGVPVFWLSERGRVSLRFVTTGDCAGGLCVKASLANSWNLRQ
jgi:hypothetical protein